MLKFDWAAKLQFGLQYLSAPKFSTFPQLDELFVKELNSCTLCCCWVSFCDLFYHHIQELINLVPGHLLFNDCVVFGESWCFGVETSASWSDNSMFKLSNQRAGGDIKYHSVVIAYTLGEWKHFESTNFQVKRCLDFGTLYESIRLCAIPVFVVDFHEI